MTLTLLLDLDNTLLDSDMDNFVPAYFQLLSKALDGYVAPDKLFKYLMQGTDAMVANDNPTERLEEVFSREFYPNLDVGRDVLDPIIAHFYENIFPSLAYLTKARPEAVDLVEWAFAQGYRVAISTNPLFPKAAIYHRLRWAGLDPKNYPFDIISSFEGFHFSKPNPAYLAEVLGRMGWNDGAVLVVGDDPVRDLLAAEELGLAAYWVADDDATLPKGRKSPLGRGKIEGLRSWIESIDEKMLIPQFQAKSAIVATVKATPAVLTEILSDLSHRVWTESSHPEEWSLLEIINHLRDVERGIYLRRTQKSQHEGDNQSVNIDYANLWIPEPAYADQNGEAVVQEFVDARMETLSALKKLTAEDWQNTRQHAILGQITLQEQMAFMAKYDRVYLRKINALLKK